MGIWGSRRVLALVTVGALGAAVGLAGCATGASTTTRTLTLDGGALIVQPAATQPVLYSKMSALYDLTHSVRLGQGWSVDEIDFGYVTIRPNVFGAPVPAPRHRLAWVLFYRPGQFTSSAPPLCPGGATPSPGPSRSAMIVDALANAAYVYKGGGAADCGQVVLPTAGQAGQFISVPWIDLGKGWVRVTYPGCFKGGVGTPMTGNVGSGGTYTKIQVLAVGVIGPCSSPPSTTDLDLAIAPSLNATFPRPWIHGDTGPVPLGGFGF